MNRTAEWYEANQRVLAAGIGAMREVLERITDDPADTSALALVESALAAAEAEMPAPSSLAELVGRFQLTAFERDLLLLCVGIELDPAMISAWQQAVGVPEVVYPTFSHALEVLPNAHWSAITPAAVLRRARLLSVGEGPTLGARPLRIEESVLHFLNGLPELDPRLDGIVVPHRGSIPFATFQRVAADRILRMLNSTRSAGEGWPIVHIVTRDRVAALSVAAHAASGIGAALCRLAPEALPLDQDTAAGLVDLWDRDSVLLTSALFVDLTSEQAAGRRRSVLRALNRQRGLLFLASPAEERGITRATFRVELRRPSTDERRSLWRGFLEGMPDLADRSIAAAAEAYPFDVTTMAEVAEELRFEPGGDGNEDDEDRLRVHCRERMRGALDPVAQRVDVSADWEDLVLPPLQLEMLRSIAAQIRNRPRISRLWTAQGKAADGPAVLFVGERGTGKTLAASVIARQLRRDLYRVEMTDFLGTGGLAARRRIRDILGAAAGAEIVLLAELPDDFLVEGSRSGGQVESARVRALLGTVGAVPVIFESREVGAVPESFSQEMRFVVRFPHPSGDLRREIWRRVFPEQVERQTIDYEKLARLPLVGGSIRAIAFEAALRAAEDGGAVSMAHLERAARVEYAKLGKTLSPVETKGWTTAEPAKRGQKEGEKR